MTLGFLILVVLVVIALVWAYTRPVQFAATGASRGTENPTNP
jgi:hypothetical protein